MKEGEATSEIEVVRYRMNLVKSSNHALGMVVVVVVGLRGIEEVTVFPVPAYLTAGDSCANPIEGGSYL
jgi:hypothetical protein